MSMYKTFAIAAAMVLVPSVAMSATVYNTAPTAGWNYGSGAVNNYSPANTAVFTSTTGVTAGTELFLRWHVNTQLAPASDSNGVYSFTTADTATKALSFDYGYTLAAGLSLSDYVATITLTNLLDPDKVVSFTASSIPDNYVNGNTVENSERLSFSFLSDLGYDQFAAGDYSVNLTLNNINSNVRSNLTLTTEAQIAAVPEPASWAMMVGGFGLLGGALRRKKAAVRFA